ncbi:ATP-dependent helicase [Selenomonas ruminantium]|uniref:DNA 3'-5' helicase n=1 Tax=Selenomonas ruminantium TaxID=971 RepID=A0A1I0Y2Y2_SELRU|nr:3'-5' exonuclease [Selenomonas ruminantium]SFB06563.1 DNA helicase-2 / ATP-dependent DNA helicase PcrA [Selenomonas ruminantium]
MKKEQKNVILAGLSAAQYEAVTETEGCVRVIAGAGSGKTRALTRRYAYLVKEIGIMPENILCMTFTNKAAAEMRKRIRHLIGDCDAGYINTFHSFCVTVLKEESYVIQYPKSFIVLDNSDIDAMLKIIYEEKNLSLRDMTYAKARAMIQKRKTSIEPEYHQDMIALSTEAFKEKYLGAVEPEDIIFYGYLYQEKKCFGLDYTDLIVFTLHILEKMEDIRLKWQKKLEYIMVDEFQDIDELQYQLVKILSGYHKNLFVVGDPDQTIYTWRGANINYIKEFDKEFIPTKTFFMVENYRSTPEILNVANALISKNHHRIEKKLVSTIPAGEKVLCSSCDSPEIEAKWIVGEISKLHNNGVSYQDIAILYRAHYLTRTIEEMFMKEGLPYVLYSGTHFFDRKEIKDALSYLRMIIYKDDLSFQRVVNEPKRKVGKTRMTFLHDYAKQNNCTLYKALSDNLELDLFKKTKARDFVSLIEEISANYSGRPVSEVLADVLDASGYEEMLRNEGNQERLDNMAELKQSIYEYEASCGEEAMLEHYLSRVALFTNSDVAGQGDKVKLMTIHAAKGLEFPYVFLCGLNEGVFPSRNVKTIEGMEEERRLAFVAVTRAEKRLYLSAAGGINFDESVRYPSRFLLDIDENLLEYANPISDKEKKDALDYIKEMESIIGRTAEEKIGHYCEGDKVEHKIFGTGEIISVDTSMDVYIIQFDKINTPRRISMKVEMEKI